MSVRKFKPRKKIPKQRLIDEIKKGKSLDKIGQEFNVARSYISEMCKMYDIDIQELREEYKIKRDEYGGEFIDEFYYIIKRPLKQMKW